jgi:hypothetical protein
MNCEVVVWTGLIWLRIGTGVGHLWMRYWTFGLHKMRGISWVGENRVASQEGLTEWSKWGSCIVIYISFGFTINIHLLCCAVCNRLCEGLLGVAPWTLTIFLSLSLCLRRDQRGPTSQPSHTLPDLFDTDIHTQFQYIDSSRSSDCPLPKPLAAASQYLELPVHCSSVFL